jgi:hypothetical protein
MRRTIVCGVAIVVVVALTGCQQGTGEDATRAVPESVASASEDSAPSAESAPLVTDLVALADPESLPRSEHPGLEVRLDRCTYLGDDLWEAHGAVRGAAEGPTAVTVALTIVAGDIGAGPVASGTLMDDGYGSVRMRAGGDLAFLGEWATSAARDGDALACQLTITDDVGAAASRFVDVDVAEPARGQAGEPRPAVEDPPARAAGDVAVFAYRGGEVLVTYDEQGLGFAVEVVGGGFIDDGSVGAPGETWQNCWWAERHDDRDGPGFTVVVTEFPGSRVRFGRDLELSTQVLVTPVGRFAAGFHPEAVGPRPSEILRSDGTRAPCL